MGILRTPFKKGHITNLIGDITSNTNSYYVFASHPLHFPDDNNPPGVLGDYFNAVFDPVKEMVFAKRIQTNDLRYMIPRYTWTVGTVYNQYTDTDSNLSTEQFFVITDQMHVFKCLFNNRGAVSTAKPNLTQVPIFTTADGYIWKYLFTVSSADDSRFGTTGYFPYTANGAQSGAASNSLDVLEIVAGGNGYLTSTSGTVQSITGNNKIIQIAFSARPDNDFFNKCTFYVTNGTAAGNARTITDYVSNTTGNWAVLDAGITGMVPSLTTYEINPSIQIIGDGQNANAICRVANGVVSQIVILNAGNNYTRAVASVVANTAYGSGAKVAAYCAPMGGHAANPLNELFCDTMGLSVAFANTEINTISTAVSFRSVGIIKNPGTRANAATRLVSNTFSQIFSCNTTPVVTFTANNYVQASLSGGKGNIISYTGGVLSLSGDKNFNTLGTDNLVEYTANGVPTGVSANIHTIFSNGAMNVASGEILYLTNFQPVTRSETTTETIKLIIKV